jgi:hypothetical protein
MAGAMTVLPWADMPVGIQGQAAQRARWPARLDDLGGTLGEGTRGARRDPHPQHSRAVRGEVLGQRLTWNFSSTTLVTRPLEVACR